MIGHWPENCAFALVLALAACGQGKSAQSGPETEIVGGQNQSAQSAQSSAEIELVRGQAAIEAVEVVPDPSDASKAQVVARGYLADGCTRKDRVEVSRGSGNLIASVTITTLRPAGLACIQVIKPFEERIAADIAGLPDGIYAVEVNGVIWSFEIAAGAVQRTR